MNKLCKSTCYVSIVLFIATIYLNLKVDKSKYTNDFIKSLSNPLKIEYKQRIDERKNIYFKGYALGLFLSGIVLIYNTHITNNPMSKISSICLVGFITLVTSYLYYILSKKQKLMINILETNKQKKLWSKIYKDMQFNYHTGIVIGLLSVITFSYSVC